MAQKDVIEIGGQSIPLATFAQEYLGTSHATNYLRSLGLELGYSVLSNRRIQNDNPPYIKIYDAYLYKKTDLDAWAQSNEAARYLVNPEDREVRLLQNKADKLRERADAMAVAAAAARLAAVNVEKEAVKSV